MGFLALALVNTWTAYLTRRDANIREAHTCNALVAQLTTELTFVKERTTDASAALEKPPTNPLGIIVVVPPTDEELLRQEVSFGLLDAAEVKGVFQTAFLYHAFCTDLEGTKANYHAGDTYGVPDAANISIYRNVAIDISTYAEQAITQLKTSRHCQSLQQTPFVLPW